MFPFTITPYKGDWRDHIPYGVQSIIGLAISWSGSDWSVGGGTVIAQGPGHYMGTIDPNGTFIVFPPEQKENYAYSF